MIQIIGYREYFNKTKEIWDTKHVLFPMPTEIQSIPDLFANLDKYLFEIEESERYNLHYTIADCYEAPRLFKSQSTIPFDLDDIDCSRLDSYITLMEEITGIPHTEMGVTFSGHGLHFLIETTYTINSEEELKAAQPAYKRICASMTKAFKDAGLPGKADPMILRLAATLRFPGSVNAPMRKAKNQDWPEVLSFVINTKMTPHAYYLSSGPEASIDQQVTSGELRNFPRPDTEFVIKECNFLDWNFTSPNEVSEPEWYAALSIVGILDNGRDLAHQMSRGHANYDYTVTDQKLTQAMEKSGPRTCGNIDSISDKCRSCKYFGQITSPVLLRGPDYIKTFDTGFWEIGFDKNGKPKPVKPAYDDLRKFFEKTHQYISLPSGSTFIWKETHWIELEEIFVRSFIQDNLNPRPSNSHVLEFLALIRRTNVRTETFFDDTTIGRVNLKNGVLKLDSMELETHDSKYGFRYCLTHSFDVGATCPRFDKFMEEITLGRTDLSNVLMEYAAYAFSGMPYIYHKALIMSGEGANGKSTFISVLKKLAGSDSYSTIMLNELEQEYKRAYMIGKLFNVAEETPVKSMDDSSYFKVLSAGGGYMAREIYKKPTNVTNNRTKLIMACNELPNMTDFSEGFMRRLIIVPFDAKFSEGNGNVDVDIEEKLHGELSGIFNRVVEAYQRLRLQKGFTKSVVVDLAIKEYRDNQNNVLDWFNASVDMSNEDTYVLVGNLYKSYVEWCKPMAIRPVTTTKFGLEMSRTSGRKSFYKKLDGKALKVYPGLRMIHNIGDFNA